MAIRYRTGVNGLMRAHWNHQWFN